MPDAGEIIKPGAELSGVFIVLLDRSLNNW